MGPASGTVHTTERVARLRKLMESKEYNVDAYVVPSEDQHASEYSADCDERRAYISGFNGSAGCAIITQKEALLFTDGRYFLQAEKQLDENWKLMKTGLKDVPTWQEYLQKVIPESSRVGVDASLLSIDDATTLSKAMKPRKCELVSLEKNLVDETWGTEQPARPRNPVSYLDVKYSGESHQDKLKRVRDEITKKKAKTLVLNGLDEIAWLFNLRGSDIAYNPVFFSYTIVTTESATLFTNNELKESEGSLQQVLSDAVKVEPYEAFWARLKELGEKIDAKSEEKILISNQASLAVANAIGEGKYTSILSPVTLLKSIKNKTELEGFRQSHIRDGVALARYFSWLEEELNQGKEHSEWDAATKLEEYRKELDLFVGLSFPTISSTGPNGAIIHYGPSPTDSAIIKKDQIYLCDSGAQFLDGTTDVTRTWHFGSPTEEEKRAFTRVLQGHIALDIGVFPNGTTGYIIDSWARRPLWEDGLDYRHGTGHGVGHFLNVHEGPHGIGVRIGHNANPLKPGMTVSNEPGYYADGKFGIRIENIVLVKDVKTLNNFDEKGFLGFEHVTLSPIHTKLINKSLLSARETQWLNDYHKEVWDKVSPHLKNDQRALDWLKRECAAI